MDEKLAELEARAAQGVTQICIICRKPKALDDFFESTKRKGTRTKTCIECGSKPTGEKRRTIRDLVPDEAAADEHLTHFGFETDVQGLEGAKQLAEQATVAIFKQLVARALNGDTHATKLLLEYTYGSPKQHVKHEGQTLAEILADLPTTEATDSR